MNRERNQGRKQNGPLTDQHLWARVLKKQGGRLEPPKSQWLAKIVKKKPGATGN